MNIEGLVGGYTGPGGKTILPHRAVAKIDLRLVPDMKKDDAVAALKAHLATHGFGDIEVNVTGGYDPTSTPASARLIQAQIAVLKRAGIDPVLWPRNAGSYPGYVFTGEPLKLASGHFGLGHGSGAHAPDEYYVIESDEPEGAGLRRRGDVVRSVSVRAREITPATGGNAMAGQTSKKSVKVTKKTAAKRVAAKTGKPRKAVTKSSAPSRSDMGDWREETLARMRALILEADPEMIEERKWRKASNAMQGVPVWSHDGIICTGEMYTKVVKLTFAKGASLPDPSRLFNSSLDGNTRRAIDIHEGEKIDARAFKALVKVAVAQNASTKRR